MKVVKDLSNEDLNQESTEKQPGFIRMKKFPFIMLLFFVVFITAGITTLALSFGDEKAVNVGTNERSEFNKLYMAYDTLNNNYYEKVDKDDLMNGAINGMLDALDDPYSDYMNVDEAKNFHDSIASSFEGIGAEISEQEGHIVIVSPLKGSPAEKAGLQPNDKVMSVDGESLQGMSSSEAVLLIRGEKGTDVELEVLRPGTEESVKMTITRDTIPIETVYGEMIEDDIAKVQITSFSENTAQELVDTLNELKKEGMKGLVLDLRQNPGGLLDQAIEISSLFVPEGEILFQIEDRNGNKEAVQSVNKENKDIPLVVVIDKGSASASEILAAAVQESAGIELVGEKSFGKGTVQRAQDFSDGSNMKFTTEKWLTPDGNWIHSEGITPDHKVSLPDYASLPFLNPEAELKLSSSSNQVKVAQEMLKAVGHDPGRVDGFFDEKTEEAVKAFQEEAELESTGVLSGESTLKLMEELRKQVIENDTQIKKAVEVLQEKMK
ncbi:carboxyl-terminal processing protease [Cytobacillus horneckiae]|uniref:Peptidase S41 n=1 Tax=Cytobacillus horneckiae TaxID=549687 RepID=A0A2N0ZKS8_9BACI|nr:S41 family peptidase [Cytobacillus horneckiae]NRG46185.1 S41 family peptidase [Bacillus sp. CRN 9]MBN6885537.1 S41 family peptidase [Cytobacillus horneckiae]MCM3180402.1 S41 family peptidase [Cytobacillus horneckiae]MEC1156351.1 S41 family peptidase [Cytobacillus horneckiae]MED2938369.1 S41 family peptidase [Cytobacillus horneckiae]